MSKITNRNNMTPAQHKKFIADVRRITREMNEELERLDNEYLVKKAEIMANYGDSQ